VEFATLSFNKQGKVVFHGYSSEEIDALLKEENVVVAVPAA
jgi:hypothetical protein